MNTTPNFAVAGLELCHQGKVRDTYKLPNWPDMRLVVATDRVSTHNIVHNSTVPGKGVALTTLTVFWMEKLAKAGVETHLVASGEKVADFLPSAVYTPELAKRAIVVRWLRVIPIEFIFRSRMAGSLWQGYKKGQPNPYGLYLDGDLELMSPFNLPIFTPTEKSDVDEPLLAKAVLREHPAACDLARRVYEFGRHFAAEKGIEILDGKFEIGINAHGRPVLVDECLTPDSCRFVDARNVFVGQEPKWLDKQFLREYAERTWGFGIGNKTPLSFPDDVITETVARYEQIVGTLTN